MARLFFLTLFFCVCGDACGLGAFIFRGRPWVLLFLLALNFLAILFGWMLPPKRKPLPSWSHLKDAFLRQRKEICLRLICSVIIAVLTRPPFYEIGVYFLLLSLRDSMSAFSPKKVSYSPAEKKAYWIFTIQALMFLVGTILHYF